MIDISSSARYPQQGSYGGRRYLQVGTIRQNYLQTNLGLKVDMHIKTGYPRPLKYPDPVVNWVCLRFGCLRAPKIHPNFEFASPGTRVPGSTGSYPGTLVQVIHTRGTRYQGYPSVFSVCTFCILARSLCCIPKLMAILQRFRIFRTCRATQICFFSYTSRVPAYGRPRVVNLSLFY